jgi:hypothetical protein
MRIFQTIKTELLVNSGRTNLTLKETNHKKFILENEIIAWT